MRASDFRAPIAQRITEQEREDIRRAWATAKKTEFQNLYRATCELSLTELLATKTQVLRDWAQVGDSESRLQIAVLEARIDKVRTITQRHGCPDPLPSYERTVTL